MSKAWKVAGPAVLLACMFVAVIGLGYATLALTGTLHDGVSSGGRMARELNLTPGEEEAFIPLYQEYRKELDEARKGLREARENLPSNNGATLTEEEASGRIEAYIEALGNEKAVVEKFNNRFLEIIPGHKAARVFADR